MLSTGFLLCMCSHVLQLRSALLLGTRVFNDSLNDMKVSAVLWGLCTFNVVMSTHMLVMCSFLLVWDDSDGEDIICFDYLFL